MQTSKQVSLQSFIKHNHIRLDHDRADSNHCMDNSANMDNYKCILHANRSRMTVYFSKGYGHNGEPPKADEVLNCLALDASSYQNARSFEDWCYESGYSSDSRKAEKLWLAVERQTKKLQKLLGESAYENLLWHTERL